MIHFTETEKRLLDLLRDGKPHSVQEIKEVIDPEHPDLVDSWAGPISRLRGKVNQQGYTIMFALRSREVSYSHYMLVRKLHGREELPLP